MNAKVFALRVAAVAAVTASLSGAAMAGPVSSTLSATYFEVRDGSDPDFNVFNTPNVLNGSVLGPDGLPVATAPFGVNDIGAGNQITWWSPTLNSHVVETGTGTITLPYASNMYAPDSLGGNDGTFFETAVFTGTFSLASNATVQFSLGSDDDSFIYVDNVLFGQNPGVHGVTNVAFTSPLLSAGSHNIEVFFADRQNTGAFLSLSLLSDDVVIAPGVPEPATWAMMLIGFGAIGFAMRGKKDRFSTI
jgi:hypothetical protein